MFVPDCLKWPIVYNFALRIHCELDQPRSIALDERQLTASIKGKLNLSHDDVTTRVAASCRFTITPDWLSELPYVAADDPWVIRGNADWHTYPDGSLCFEFDERWSDVISDIATLEGLGVAAEFAKTWCLRSTRWLLWKHLVAHREGIVVWPKEWKFWPHGRAAARQRYSQLRARN